MVGRSLWRTAFWTLKAALVALLLFALLHPDWDRFADKAMGIRAIAYPLTALLVAAVWAIWSQLREPMVFRGTWTR